MADARAPLKPGAASCEGAKRAAAREHVRRAAARMRSAIPERGFGDAGRQLELHGLLDTRHRLDADRAQLAQRLDRVEHDRFGSGRAGSEA